MMALPGLKLFNGFLLHFSKTQMSCHVLLQNLMTWSLTTLPYIISYHNSSVSVLQHAALSVPQVHQVHFCLRVFVFVVFPYQETLSPNLYEANSILLFRSQFKCYLHSETKSLPHQIIYFFRALSLSRIIFLVYLSSFLPQNRKFFESRNLVCSVYCCIPSTSKTKNPYCIACT